MERIGHGWEDRTLDVFQEHLASHAVASALIELNEQASRTLRTPAPLALGATPEGDPYILPLLLGELVLREQGWDVRNLGVNLPLRSLAAAVLGYRPGLVFLSVNSLTDPVRFASDYLGFYESAAAVGTAVVLGGRALGPDLRARLLYAGYGEPDGPPFRVCAEACPRASRRRPGSTWFDKPLSRRARRGRKARD